MAPVLIQRVHFGPSCAFLRPTMVTFTLTLDPLASLLGAGDGSGASYAGLTDGCEFRK